ncbi:MAG TPA: FAD-dependent oxidoreductase, partial [Gemmatimonadaceae bacterium]|nr:FAD-dependent oxidoreductase [Gemmatimonadaceae bacterium]
MNPGNPIVIIGAGVAGLTAAVRLSRAGRRVVVFEARPRLGGRATAFHDRITGEPVDNGQHVLFGCYHETLALLRTIGAEQNVRIQPTLDVPYLDERGRPTRLHCPPLPAPFHLLGGLLKWEALSWRDKMSAIRLAQTLKSDRDEFQFLQRFRRRLQKLKFVPIERAVRAREWLIAEGQTPRVRELLWEPLAVAALNEPADAASAELFAVILSRLFGRSRLDASIVMPTVPLDRMYAEPARAFSEAHGGDVRTNALARVVIKGGRITAVRSGDHTIPATVAISAVAWHAFANLFEDTAGARCMPDALREVADNAARMRSMPI